MTKSEIGERDRQLALEVKGLLASALGDLRDQHAFASAMTVVGFVAADILADNNPSPVMAAIGAQMIGDHIMQHLQADR